MSAQAEARIILVAWGLLLLLYILNRLWVKDRLVGRSTLVQQNARAGSEARPGTRLSRAGTLWVFLANILTLALVLAAPLFPAVERSLSLVRVSFPPSIHGLGAALFVIDSLWGFLTLVFNPGYTPLTMRMRDRFVLATRGPYGLVRHPRYASEALLNVVLFLFTGLWLPLLGLIGWPALYSQARAEERSLLAVAGEAYARYRRDTGMFFPKR